MRFQNKEDKSEIVKDSGAPPQNKLETIAEFIYCFKQSRNFYPIAYLHHQKLYILSLILQTLLFLI